MTVFSIQVAGNEIMSSKILTFYENIIIINFINFIYIAPFIQNMQLKAFYILKRNKTRKYRKKVKVLNIAEKSNFLETPSLLVGNILKIWFLLLQTEHFFFQMFECF